MNKPASLRAHLLAAVPELRHSNDRLLIFIDNGKVRCTAAASLSFEYSYDLQVILTDFAGHPDSVMLPLLGWLKVNQSELLENLEKSADGIKFEADLIDKGKVDMSLNLPLTERVVVRTDDEGNVTITHPGEPQRNPDWPGSGPEWIVPHG
ncbi:phage tail protein [Pseudomonas agarici]|uniref:phage tail protein n=1 Tax=Pseudomonas agarici TaxID=46677 RepID=UPI0015A3749E|nr:phage tail protein [Pseudomonas agarici]NWB91604.1 phage tail protein [Pseudomonas agarici]